MPLTTVKGLLGAERLHARVEDLKRTKGPAPWVAEIVATDRHYHLVDEWWVVMDGEIDWEIEGHPEVVHARAGDIVFAPAMHDHHIRPTGDRAAVRLAITPAGQFHRHDRPAGTGPNGR